MYAPRARLRKSALRPNYYYNYYIERTLNCLDIALLILTSAPAFLKIGRQRSLTDVTVAGWNKQTDKSAWRITDMHSSSHVAALACLVVPVQPKPRRGLLVRLEIITRSCHSQWRSWQLSGLFALFLSRTPFGHHVGPFSQSQILLCDHGIWGVLHRFSHFI